MTTLEKLQKFLRKKIIATENNAFGIRPPITCKDGYELSVQASRGHYCTPRKDNASYYTRVEVGFPSEHDDLLGESDDGFGVYAFVPVENVAVLINKHGGMID